MPIAPARSGANFCICSSPRDGARDERGDDRETVWASKSEPGKVSEPRLASMLGECQKVKQPKRGMLRRRTKYIEEKEGGSVQRGGNGGKENHRVNLWS